MRVRELAPRVVERGRRPRQAALEGPRGTRVEVEVARVRQRPLLEERLRVALVVLRADAEERDAPTVLPGEPLEEGKLEAARAAPRRPLVHHDRVTAQGRDLLLERRRATA